jgi:hypothetical protein
MRCRRSRANAISNSRRAISFSCGLACLGRGSACRPRIGWLIVSRVCRSMLESNRVSGCCALYGIIILRLLRPMLLALRFTRLWTLSLICIIIFWLVGVFLSGRCLIWRSWLWRASVWVVGVSLSPVVRWTAPGECLVRLTAWLFSSRVISSVNPRKFEAMGGSSFALHLPSAGALYLLPTSTSTTTTTHLQWGSWQILLLKGQNKNVYLMTPGIIDAIEITWCSHKANVIRHCISVESFLLMGEVEYDSWWVVEKYIHVIE